MPKLLQTAVCALVLSLLWVGSAAAQDGTGASSEAPHPSDSLDRRDIVFASERVGSDIEIWRMGADGSNPRRLTHNEGVRDNFPAWSPDRRRIAFLSNRDTSRQGTGIYVMGADGSDVRAVGPRNWPLMLFPEWSPDGRELLFSAGSSLLDLDLYLMEADGSNLRQLTSGRPWSAAPVGAPRAIGCSIRLTAATPRA
jgi:TolB protein